MSIFVNENGTLVRKDAAEASQLAYDNASSGLSANTVQGAIDEIDGSVDTLNSSLTDQQGEIDAILDVYGAKNIMPLNPLLANGSVSCSVQDNGTARYNGTTSDIRWCGITQPTGNPVGDTYTTLLRKGTYKFIVKSSQALSSNVQVALFSPAATTIKNFSSGTNNKYEFTLSVDTYVYVGVRFAANTSLSNFDIQAYIIDARVKDESFVGYALTNRELTDAVKNIDLTNNNQTNTTVSSATWTNIGSVTLTKGKYLLIGTVSIAKQNFSGEVTLTLNETATPAQGNARYDNATGIIPTSNSGGVQISKIVDITDASKTIYMHAYHTGSSSFTMYPGISVIRLK